MRKLPTNATGKNHRPNASIFGSHWRFQRDGGGGAAPPQFFPRHYNAPKFYSQLQDATPEKFQKVGWVAVWSGFLSMVCFYFYFYLAIPTKFGIPYYKCNVIWWLAFWVGGMSKYWIWFLGGEKFDRTKHWWHDSQFDKHIFKLDWIHHTYTYTYIYIMTMIL